MLAGRREMSNTLMSELGLPLSVMHAVLDYSNKSVLSPGYVVNFSVVGGTRILFILCKMIIINLMQNMRYFDHFICQHNVKWREPHSVWGVTGALFLSVCFIATTHAYIHT